MNCMKIFSKYQRAAKARLVQLSYMVFVMHHNISFFFNIRTPLPAKFSPSRANSRQKSYNRNENYLTFGKQLLRIENEIEFETQLVMGLYLLMPTVGRATEVNMNLLISISEEGSWLLWNYDTTSPLSLNTSSSMASSRNTPKRFRQRRLKMIFFKRKRLSRASTQEGIDRNGNFPKLAI